MNEMSAFHASTISVLDRIRAVIPEIEARVSEIEAGGRVPLDLLERLESAGAFRLCVPTMFGGEDVTQADACQAIEEVARADASVAWHMMVAAGSQVLTSRIPAESLSEYYAHGPDTWPKAAAAPKGAAIPVEGGYKLSGRWPLASGSRNFEWISLGFMIKDEGGIRRLANGVPDMRICLVPRGDARIIETWDAVGMRGTRSDDIEVHDLFIPEAWQGPFGGTSTIGGTTLSISMPSATATHHLGVVKGILRGAVADLATDSLTRKPAFNPTVTMKDDAVFRSRFGEIASRVDAICALADMVVSMLHRCNVEGRDVTRAESAQIGSAQSLVHHDATSLMDQIMLLSGSAGVYMTSRMQRRWRDLRCAAQHQAANIGNYATHAVALIEKAAMH